MPSARLRSRRRLNYRRGGRGGHGGGPPNEDHPDDILPERCRPSVVAMEACCGAHHLGRVLREAQKNDERDAEAIAEAATRPTMRFVELKSESPARSPDLRELSRQLLPAPTLARNSFGSNSPSVLVAMAHLVTVSAIATAGPLSPLSHELMTCELFCTNARISSGVCYCVWVAEELETGRARDGTSE